MFWIINNTDYSKLREIDGCELLTDPSDQNSGKDDMFKMAKGFEVEDDNLFIDTEQDMNQLDETYQKILERS